MTELVIRNKELISQLDWIKDKIITSGIENLWQKPDRLVFHPENWMETGEKYLSEAYLHKHMENPEHIGYPIERSAVPLHAVQNDHPNLAEVYRFGSDEFVREWRMEDYATFLYYPPGGFVGWHTNENNPGYQFLFSWSEKGDGYFQYYDKQKQEIVKIPDQPGWQARTYLFGQDSPDHCWHSMYTNVPRISICLILRHWNFPKQIRSDKSLTRPLQKDQVIALRDQIIEEIESEY